MAEAKDDIEFVKLRGLFTGTGEEEFLQDMAITREQMPGIILGKDDNIFDPKAPATRAEGSRLLKSFIDILEN